MIIDLHQDWSDNSLSTTHKDFFAKEDNTYGRNMEWMNAVNHVSLEKLKKSWVAAVIAALFIEPETMKAGDNLFSNNNTPTQAAAYELFRHNKFYDYLVSASKWEIRQILNGDQLEQCIKDWKLWLIKHIEWYYIQDPSWNMDSLDKLYDMWVRSIWLTWNVDNILAQGSHKEKQTHWLTTLWRQFVKKVVDKWMILDLAHLSRRSVEEALEIISSPMMVSHTALTSDTDNHRFITPKQATQVANKWWIIWLAIMKHDDNQYPLLNTDDYVTQLESLINLVWEDHVALGTDFDGVEEDHVIEGFNDASKYHLVIDKMKKKWMTENKIDKVMWWNAKRFIQDVL